MLMTVFVFDKNINTKAVFETLVHLILIKCIFVI
jgi:hypothetical protein